MFEQIMRAMTCLSGIVHRTPVFTSKLLNDFTGNDIYLKCENFQRMGAFKFRGAYNALSNLTQSERQKGVVTFSSGNHAQAVALAGKLLNVPTAVIMPLDAPAVKSAAAKSYEAEIVFYNRHNESRENLAQHYVEERGYTLIPPFDHYDVIAGQGTAACELIDEVGLLDYLFTPCGGGGLLSGCAAYTKHVLPNCKVIGVEPETADDATRSFKAGSLVSITNPATVADGLRTSSLGTLTFPLIMKYVDDMVNVSETDILAAMYFLWTRLKIVVEPSGAVGLAPFFGQRRSITGKRVGIILSGGNVDVRYVGELFAGIQNG